MRVERIINRIPPHRSDLVAGTVSGFHHHPRGVGNLGRSFEGRSCAVVFNTAERSPAAATTLGECADRLCISSGRARCLPQGIGRLRDGMEAILVRMLGNYQLSCAPAAASEEEPFRASRYIWTWTRIPTPFGPAERFLLATIGSTDYDSMARRYVAKIDERSWNALYDPHRR